MRAHKRATFLLVALIAVLVCAGAALAVVSMHSASPTLKAARNGKLGVKILVNSNGRTLYRFTVDKKRSSSCKASCRKAWPPLLVKGKPTVGSGLSKAKVGTIKRPDGGVQVTYAGYPLYLFTSDAKSGQVNGQGYEHTWYVVTTSGAVSKAKASGGGDTTTTTPTTTTPTTTSGGGGYNY